MVRTLLASLLGAALLGCASSPSSDPASADPAGVASQAGRDGGGVVDTVIRGGTVVTMDPARRVLEGGSVVIRGPEIVAVLPVGEAPPRARRVIDATGHLVIPGLVNTHGHAAMVLFRGIADDMALMEWLNDFIFPAEARTVDEDFVYWGTLLAAVEMVRSGTTTYSDMYYFEDAVARATAEVGMRGVLGQTVIGFKAPDYATPEAALAGTEQFIARWREHPLVVPSVAPHALYTTDVAVVRRCAELARRTGVPFQIHANESPAEDEAVRQRCGATSVELLAREGLLVPRTLIHHGITLSAAERAALAKAGAGVSHNPESNMKGASGLADVDALRAAGVAVGLGTDGPAGNNNLDLFEELDTCAKVHKLLAKSPTAMPAREVFELATLGGARALGLADRIGSLEPGKLADVVLIDARVPELTPLYDVYSQLVYAVKGANVRTVLVHGKPVVVDREVRTVDVSRILREARRLQRKVLENLAAFRREKRKG
ncbi:MAG: amidohydrolase family protein [Planctomycetota bacterium]